MTFKDKVVLITGGSRGIGKAIAFAFAFKGAKVVINYRSNKAAAQETLDQLPKGEHSIIQGDISKADVVRILINNVMEKHSRIDIVVNNAGIFEKHPIEEINYTQWQYTWQRTLNTNLVGVANVCYCASQYMIQQKGGKIINISSRGAFRGEPDHPAYGASKAGLNSMSQSLAKALAKHNIFVGVIAPGYVMTDMTKDQLEGPEGKSIKAQSPLNRVAKPAEIAAAVLFMAGEDSAYMTGAILDINGASYFR